MGYGGSSILSSWVERVTSGKMEPTGVPVLDGESGDDYGPAITASAIAIMLFTGAIVFMRLGIRWHLYRIFLDDVLILMSWCLVVGFCCDMIYASTIGLGQHQSTIPPADLPAVLNSITVASVMFSAAMALAKASFAISFTRLLADRRIRILNNCILVFLFLQATEETMIVVFQCQPIEKTWRPELEGHCLDLTKSWWASFFFNLMTDAILYTEPIPFIWRLQMMDTAKKIGIILMLSLGMFVPIISVFRWSKAIRTDKQDDTYFLSAPLIWSMAEPSALIVCSCIPSLRQVVRRVPCLSRQIDRFCAQSPPKWFERGRLRWWGQPSEHPVENEPVSVGLQRLYYGGNTADGYSYHDQPRRGSIRREGAGREGGGETCCTCGREKRTEECCGRGVVQEVELTSLDRVDRTKEKPPESESDATTRPDTSGGMSTRPKSGEGGGGDLVPVSIMDLEAAHPANHLHPPAV